MPTALPGTPVTGANRLARFVTASLARELGILIALSVMFPFMVHVLPVPADARLGARLLPMFYAPLLATLWSRRESALAVALFAPALNWALPGPPAPDGIALLTIQLLVFVMALRVLLAAAGLRSYLGAPAYLLALAASALLGALVPRLIAGRPAFAWAAQSAAIGLPGLAMLVVIGWLALRHYPPGSAAA